MISERFAIKVLLYKIHQGWKMKLNCGNFHAMIYYDFQCGLIKQQCVDQFVLTFGDEAPHQATMFYWFAEFNCGQRSLKNEFCEGHSKSIILTGYINTVCIW